MWWKPLAGAVVGAAGAAGAMVGGPIGVAVAGAGAGVILSQMVDGDDDGSGDRDDDEIDAVPRLRYQRRFSRISPAKTGLEKGKRGGTALRANFVVSSPLLSETCSDAARGQPRSRLASVCRVRV